MKNSCLSNWSLLALSLCVFSESSLANDAMPPSRNTRLVGSLPRGISPATAFGTPPAGTTATTTEFSHAGFPIPDNASAIGIINVAGLDPYLWDIDFYASIQHTACGQLRIRLKSPLGTATYLTTNNGGTNDNVFSMTWWDDDASELTTDTLYANNTNNPSLIPEGALAAFVGENPNGAWTITVEDGTPFGTGTLASWGLRVTTLSPSPMSAPAYSIAHIIPQPIPDAPNPEMTSTINVSMQGKCISDLNLQTYITHTFSGDLQIILRSPLGTEVLVNSRNGSDFDNVFNGTLWDDDALVPVTDSIFANNVIATLRTPEGAFGAFHGEDPNGAWTIKIKDLAMPDTGTLQSWVLTITTCAGPLPEPFCFGDGSGTQCPCHNNSPVGSERGCLNGLGRGAKLTGLGVQSVSGDTLQLLTEDTPFLSYVLYWQSRYTPNAGAGSVFDDGLLCTQAPVLFLGARFTDSSLKTHFPEGGTPLHVLGNVPPEGGTRFIQCWYRNAGNVCGTESNLTNGVKINWLP